MLLYEFKGDVTSYFATRVGVPVAGGTLQDAIRAGDIAQLEKLLKAGANVNLRDGLGSTPLHDAAWAGDADAVRLFGPLLEPRR